MTIKVLNLYAGIGGNRRLWPKNIEVTAVELDLVIAEIYKSFFPEDKVIVGDAHEYLLNHYSEFDFIWASPPCPTHTRFNNLKKVQIDKGFKPQFPDMKLYEEIIFLFQYFKGLFVVENVKSYYKPLIKPYESGNHFFWSNFNISNKKPVNRHIKEEIYDEKWGFDLRNIKLSGKKKNKMLNNLVNPELARFIWNCAFNERQEVLRVG